MKVLAVLSVLAAVAISGCYGENRVVVSKTMTRTITKETHTGSFGSGTGSSGSGTRTKFATGLVGPPVDPDNLAAYLPLSAHQKQEIQWNLIQSSAHRLDKLPTAFPPPNSDMSVLMDPKYLKVSFEYEGDQMPGTRNRLIFSPLAVVCKIKFNTFKNNTSGFTGLFRSGGIGIIRLALDGISIPNFIPTGVFKIYIDGQRSRNFNLVRNVAGQKPNHNFFLNSYSNVIDKSPVDDAHIEAVFKETSDILKGGPLDRPESGFVLGLYEQASVNSDGSAVKGPIVAPYEGRAIPNPALAIDPNSKNDFRLDINKVVKPGQVIYTYWGRRTPTSKVSELIGEIVADSQCVPSEYGDQKLFFQQPSRRWSL